MHSPYNISSAGSPGLDLGFLFLATRWLIWTPDSDPVLTLTCRLCAGILGVILSYFLVQFPGTSSPQALPDLGERKMVSSGPQWWHRQWQGQVSQPGTSVSSTPSPPEKLHQPPLQEKFNVCLWLPATWTDQPRKEGRSERFSQSRAKC